MYRLHAEVQTRIYIIMCNNVLTANTKKNKKFPFIITSLCGNVCHIFIYLYIETKLYNRLGSFIFLGTRAYVFLV